MERKDVIEYYKSIYGREPTEVEIKTELGDADKISTNEGYGTPNESLEKRITQLEQRLKATQTDTHSKYDLSKNKKLLLYIKAVGQCIEGNPFLILILFLFSLLIGSLNWLVLFIMVVFFGSYPLVANNSRFILDRKIRVWLYGNVVREEKGSENIHNVIDDMYSNEEKQEERTVQQNIPVVKNSETEKQTKLLKEKELKNKKHEATVPAEKVTVHQTEPGPVNSTTGFSFNFELVSGLISIVIGSILYFYGKQDVTDLESQISSVVFQQSLNSGGYAYVIGLFLLGYGGLAIIGGMIKGGTHLKLALGEGFKIIGTLMGIILAAVACWIYMDPTQAIAEGAKEAYTSGASLETLKTLYTTIKVLPWVAMGIYGVGIMCDLMGSKNK